ASSSEAAATQLKSAANASRWAGDRAKQVRISSDGTRATAAASCRLHLPKPIIATPTDCVERPSSFATAFTYGVLGALNQYGLELTAPQPLYGLRGLDFQLMFFDPRCNLRSRCQ